MPTNRLRWGLLSTAQINLALIIPLRTSKRNQLLAVASRSQEKAEKYANKYRIKRSYGSYEKLLEDPEIDVVYNSLPNHLHAEWTIKAVQAGKHVLCEKPLALSLAEVDAISAAAQTNNKVVAEAVMYQYHPQVWKLREIVSSGRLGKIRLVRGSFTYSGTKPDNYRWNPEMGGGGLWDVGIYPLSYTRTLLGMEPLEVFGWQVIGPTGVDESFIAQLRFPEDIHAQFDCSVKVPYHAFMEIIGEQATLVIPKPFMPGLWEKPYLKRGNKTEKIKVKGTWPFSGEVEAMADAIILGRTPPFSLADSRANIMALLALFKSARTGKPVML